MQSINRVVLTGNLTRDPEVRQLTGGGVCSLRLAVNGRRRNPQTGEWEDQANYFDISVFGAQGENCARYLTKGRAVAIDGRLRWREFTRPGREQGTGRRCRRGDRAVPRRARRGQRNWERVATGGARTGLRQRIR
jgi:single stranded DNA-binding protein